MCFRHCVHWKAENHLTVFLWTAPYEQHLEQPVLEYLADSTLADENTLIVVEEDLHTDFSYVEDLGYHLVRSKEYKTNKHVFLKKMKERQTYDNSSIPGKCNTKQMSKLATDRNC